VIWNLYLHNAFKQTYQLINLTEILIFLMVFLSAIKH
jgi:hypothetical protein